MNGAPTGPDAPVLQAGRLAVGYRDHAVVAGIDLDVTAGEQVALVGTNGSGKSTVLKTLVGLLEPVGGSLEVLGGRPGSTPTRVAYLGQFHATGFVLPLQVRDVVRMGRFADHGLLGRMGRADREAVDEALARMGIEDLAHRPLRDLSGGQQQRTFLAQVLARRAELLVLDEPTAGIDAAGRERYLTAVADERARGATVIVATHDIAEAALGSQVLLLAGRLVAVGPPTEVLTPDHLLETFGIALRRVGADLVSLEQPHAHDHDHDHGFGRDQADLGHSQDLGSMEFGAIELGGGPEAATPAPPGHLPRLPPPDDPDRDATSGPTSDRRD